MVGFWRVVSVLRPSRIVGVAAAAAFLVYLAIPATMPDPGTYRGDVTVTTRSGVPGPTVTGAQVTGDAVRITMSFAAPDGGTATRQCPTAEQGYRPSVRFEDGRTLAARDSYCAANPGARVDIVPGSPLAEWVEFPADDAFGGRFGLRLPFLEETGLKFTGGRLVSGPAPSIVVGEPIDVADWAGEHPWWALLLVLVALVAAFLWINLLFGTWVRLTVTAVIIGVTVYFGYEDFVPSAIVLLTIVAPVLAVVSFVLSPLSWLFPGSGGFAGYGGSGGWSAGPGGSSFVSNWAGGGGSGGWSSGSGGGREAPTYGLYGGGPQHGTSTLADTPGGLYSDGPQHGTSTPYTEPGGFFSNDPFGSR